MLSPLSACTMADHGEFDNMVEEWLSKERVARGVNQAPAALSTPQQGFVKRNSTSSPSPRSSSALSRLQVDVSSPRYGSSVGSSPASQLSSSPTSRYRSSPLQYGHSPLSRDNFTGHDRHQYESITEETLLLKRNIHAIQLKVTRIEAQAGALSSENARMTKDVSSTKQQASQLALQCGNAISQVNIVRQRAENVEILVRNCVQRRELDNILQTLEKPLRSEFQTHFQNIGRQFAVANKRMDDMAKRTNDVFLKADAASARIGAMIKHNDHNDRSLVLRGRHDVNSSGTLGMLGDMNLSLRTKNAAQSGSVFSEEDWDRIDRHVEATVSKSQRQVTAMIDQRLGMIEHASLMADGTNDSFGQDSSNKGIHHVQMRVQDCYENVMKMGGQLAEERERRQIAVSAIRAELRVYVQELLNEHASNKQRSAMPSKQAESARAPPNAPFGLPVALAGEHARNGSGEEGTAQMMKGMELNLTNIARAAAAAEVKPIGKRLGSALEEIETLKEEVASLRAQLKAQAMAMSGEPAALLRGMSATGAVGIMPARINKNPMTAMNEHVDPTDAAEMSTLPPSTWSWSTVKAWLQTEVKASTAVIKKFETCEIVGSLLLEIELEDLTEDEDLLIDDLTERETLWAAIQKLKKENLKHESSPSSTAKQFDDDF